MNAIVKYKIDNAFTRGNEILLEKQTINDTELQYILSKETAHIKVLSLCPSALTQPATVSTTPPSPTSSRATGRTSTGST